MVRELWDVSLVGKQEGVGMQSIRSFGPAGSQPSSDPWAFANANITAVENIESFMMKYFLLNVEECCVTTSEDDSTKIER